MYFFINNGNGNVTIKKLSNSGIISFYLDGEIFFKVKKGTHDGFL